MKQVFLILHILVISLFFTLSTPVFGQENQKSKYRLKVGWVLPLSGVWIEFGDAIRNGFTLAKEEHPNLFRNIDFVTEDTESQNKKALSAFHSLRQTAKVDLTFVWAHAHVQTIAPVAEKLEHPLFGVTADGSISKGKSFIVRFAFSAEQLGRTLSAYYRSQGFQNYGALVWENSFTKDIANGFAASLKQDESFEILDNFQGSENDFKPSLLKLKSRGYDAVGVFLGPKQFSLFYRQALAMQIPLRSFGTHYFESRAEVVQAGSAIDGAEFASVMIDSKFEERYFRRFGEGKPTTFAASGYDFAVLTGNLFSKLTHRPTAREIMEIFSKGFINNGASGTYHFTNKLDEGPAFQPPVAVKRIRGGKIEIAR